MPSSTTSNYNLSQWEADDKVLRTDFNADNAKIDAALKSEVNARTALAGQVAKKAEQSALNSEVNTRTSQVNNINSTLAKKGNCTIYTTSYVGDGELTKTLTFPKLPTLFFVLANNFGMTIVPGTDCALGTNYADSGSTSTLTCSGTTVSWTFRSGNAGAQGAFGCCNENKKTYHVIAFLDAST